MAKQVIILSQNSNGTQININGLFWFPITTRPQPQSNGSQWATIPGVSVGPSPAETAAIQAGTVKEESFNFTFPIGVAPAVSEGYMQEAWAARNAEINGIGGYVYYGAYYDPSANGGTWAQQ